MDGLAIGRIVHYVLETGPNAGEERPAVIVRVLDNGGLGRGPVVNLQVFTDGADGPEYAAGVVWKTSKAYSLTPC